MISNDLVEKWRKIAMGRALLSFLPDALGAAPEIGQTTSRSVRNLTFRIVRPKVLDVARTDTPDELREFRTITYYSQGRFPFPKAAHRK